MTAVDVCDKLVAPQPGAVQHQGIGMKQYAVEEILKHAESGRLPDGLDPQRMLFEPDRIKKFAEWAKERDYRNLPDGFFALKAKDGTPVGLLAARDGFTGFQGRDWEISVPSNSEYDPPATLAYVVAMRGYTGFPPDVWGLWTNMAA